MIRIIFSILALLIFVFSAQKTFAQSNSFVSIVNPVRGGEFWEVKDQSIERGVKGQIETLSKYNLSATWLLRVDALDNTEIIDLIKRRNQDEKGLFLEITPTLTNLAGVNYHKSENWHDAGSAFLSGYERDERERLIDASFEKFKNVFGYYPISVGAWWIDAYSLEYMQEKYGIKASLEVSDQYTTDNYQIWGHFWSTPYYPSRRNALEPARNLDDKLDIVLVQWAARDPVNAYGNGVGESTFSVQANDYLDYHNLNTDYFSKLLDIYTKQPQNSFGYMVFGLENSYDWEKYGEEYKRQVEILAKKKNLGQFSILPMKDFASWYINNFPQFSPEHIILASDPLGTQKKVIWFMNTNYRAGWFYNEDGSLFRDLRQYTGGEEICYLKSCDEVNFATSATRVLDYVSFGHKWIIDEGNIKDFKFRKRGESFRITYTNEAGNLRNIEFLPKDIGIDGKTTSIDGAILNATDQNTRKINQADQLEKEAFSWSPQSATIKILKFIGFLFIVCFTFGYLPVNRILNKGSPFLQKYFLSIILGIVIFTLLYFLFNLLGFKQLIFACILINFTIFIKVLIKNKEFNKVYENFFHDLKNKSNLVIIGLISAGTIFGVIPTFKSGLEYPYGLGFWGPNTHDGVWHISLINQLMKDVPAQNPIFADQLIKNYHYFYDLLIAGTSYILKIPALDLLFRFYPILFSILLGIGTYYLITEIFKDYTKGSKMAAILGLYLVYFAGSFGWIIEYIKGRGFGGESNFWANQSISFNLNPPYAISLIIIISLIQLLHKLERPNRKTVVFILAILSGSLIAFKAYGGVLVLMSLFLVAVIKRSLIYLMVFSLSAIISATLFFTNFSLSQKLIIFSPFWLIHSMVDSSDRVGWLRLTLAREAGFAQGNWFKFISAESLGLFLFILGNLGTRIFAIFSLIHLRKIFARMESLFVFIFSMLALTIPIMFVQAGNPWNTIQFLYYFMYVSALVSGIVLSKILKRLGKIFGVFVVLVVLIITPINSWATANGYLVYQPHALITEKEWEALKFLKLQEEGIILTYPYDKRLKQRFSEPWPLFIYDSTAYVSAFSNKAVFIEDEAQNQILLTDYKKRIVASKDFFAKAATLDNSFLISNNITYIYLPKIVEIKLNEEIVEKIFENEQILIYKAKK